MAKTGASSRGRRIDDGVLVIGLGRFGSSLAETLVDLGYDVLAIDSDTRIVQTCSGRLTHVVAADSTNEEAMRQLGAEDFDRAVVGIGTDIEASILTVSVLVDLGISQIWAKAISKAHGRILQRIGAHFVVFPEHDMGQRVAHQVTGQMMDYLELEGGFVIVQTRAPRDAVDKSLTESAIRRRFGVTIVGVQRHGQDFEYATAATVLRIDDVLVVAGKRQAAERFAAQT